MPDTDWKERFKDHDPEKLKTAVYVSRSSLEMLVQAMQIMAMGTDDVLERSIQAAYDHLSNSSEIETATEGAYESTCQMVTITTATQNGLRS